jgi:hypothetical protein
MRKVDLKPAHNQLKKLLDELEGVELGALKSPGLQGVSTSGVAWREALERAVREIEGWCRSNSSPESQFSIDVRPKA